MARVKQKVTRHRFDMPLLGRTSMMIGYWFCVWITARAAFDASAGVTAFVWHYADKVVRAVYIIRETILSS